MAWFFSRKKPRGERSRPIGVDGGSHRSPGLAAFAAELDRRRPEKVLDLGGSFNENLTFLSRWAEHIAIHDVIGRSGIDLEQPRSSLLQLEGEGLEFSDTEGGFDAVLLWDLLHYLAPLERQRLIGRLARLCRPGALVFLIAAASVVIPPVPVRFRIESRDHLLYGVAGDQRVVGPRFNPRDIEQLFSGFEPVRFFQLRNGLQEFLLRFAGSREREPGPEQGLAEDQDNVERPRPKPPGDWYDR